MTYKCCCHTILTETSGLFQLEIDRYVDFETYELQHIIFTVRAKESKTFYHDCWNIYERFETEQELNTFLDKFLDQFKNLYEMFSYIYNKFDFIKPKRDHRVTAWNIMRDVLDDESSSDFEAFLEEHKNFL